MPLPHARWLVRETWRVYQHGKPITQPLEQETDCFAWLLHNRRLNVDLAKRYGGYDIRREP